MALLFCESFDDRTSDAALLARWDSWYWQQSMNYGTVASRYSLGFRMWKGDGWDRGWMLKNISSTDSTIIFGAAVWGSGTGDNYGSYGNGISIGKSGEADYIMMHLNPNTNGIRVHRGNTGATVIANSENGVWIPGKWFYMEGKVYIHDTNGTVEIRINDKVVLNETGLDTKNGTTSYIDFFRIWGCPYYGFDIRFDDIYVCDSTGSTNNDFLGDVDVKLLMPDGVGNNSDWTPSVGNNYECVDEIEPSTSDYVYTTVSGAYDTYSFETVPSGIVYGINNLFYGNRGTGGDRTFRAAARIGGANYIMNSPMTLTSTYDYRFVINETSPATTSGWTTNEINSAEFGMKMEN